MVLLISNKWDVTVDFVVLELQRRRHPYVRLNSEDFRFDQITVNLPELAIFLRRREAFIDVKRDVGAIWNRRPGLPFDDVAKSERPSDGIQVFVNDQWRMFRYALTTVPDIVWINHPDSEARTESKIHQLVLAQHLGFSVPRTLCTNDPQAIRTFAAEFPTGVVAKALYTPLIEEEDTDRFIFTTDLPTVDAPDEASVSLCPFLVQQRLNNKIDYRVTVIGDVVITARIESANGDNVELDWRTQKSGLSFVRSSLPPKITELCVAFVRACGLVFGAIDLVEHDGTFFFLEINPNGEWGWLQKPAGLPIAEHLCDALIRLDSKSR